MCYIYIAISIRFHPFIILIYTFNHPRPVTLLLVGLDNAGKTTAAKGIIGGRYCQIFN